MNFNLATQQEISLALGERLRAQRLAQDLAQEDLAARAGVSLSTLKRLESVGVCGMDSVIRVAQALGLAGGFESLFVLKIESIAQMEQAEKSTTKKRAGRARRGQLKDRTNEKT